MRVHVLYFGVLKDVVGTSGETVEVGDEREVRGLLRILRERTSNRSMDTALWERLAVAVNREYAGSDATLREGDEVALLPPVSGGAPDGAGRVQIVDEPIATEAIVAGIKAGGDGAVCVFDGIVRDNTRGRKTLYLDYEAYREMALEQMRGLATEAIARFGVREVALVHRLGRLVVGETSVLIVVASAHRGAAFDACRWLIDTLKKQVPIWKRETFVDGAVWADGEDFPDGIGIESAGGTAAQPAGSRGLAG